MKHINIPVFIPHLGCPNMCVFCNQRTISGISCFSEETVKATIEEVLSTSDGCEAEIAFFGGSFTGIDRELMTRLLDLAESYVKECRVSGIRMSTRPDYIDEEIVSILKKYTVSQIELGIQSMSDKVLEACKRGHTASQTEKAVKLLVESGFEVVGQMMVGLPGATPDDELYTARKISEMGCVASRIYPTVVFFGTELEEMLEVGKYAPLTVEEAVERSSRVLEAFEVSGVNCIRIGLCDSENLHSDTTYAAGPNHSALGELVMSRVFYNRICRQVENFLKKNDLPTDVSLATDEEKKTLSSVKLEVWCPKGTVSKIVGNKKENKEKIYRKYGIKYVKAVEKNDLLRYNIIINAIL
ncbi:MAG: radical SAM protein [Ruminococcaceae bacterium]|nr:radical SAM protein [Oscillospiraceae bacterium]